MAIRKGAFPCAPPKELRDSPLDELGIPIQFDATEAVRVNEIERPRLPVLAHHPDTKTERERFPAVFIPTALVEPLR